MNTSGKEKQLIKTNILFVLYYSNFKVKFNKDGKTKGIKSELH